MTENAAAGTAGRLKVLVILGPTASGKSALSLEVAQHVPCEIISLDSALVYRGMDVGTAKPTPEELASVPHHLINIIEPEQNYSAADFVRDCKALVPEIAARGAVPVICGGTMLYYKALCDGLSPLPQTEPAVRERIQVEGAALGWPALHERLKDIDPVLYERYAPNDKQRIARAMEVFAMTGRPMSSFYAEKGSACPFDLVEFVLLPPPDRTQLRVQIRARFEQMLRQGLLDEVRALRRRGTLTPDMPSMRCVGYRQTWEYLDGKISREELLEQAVIATARLAKHQMTWLRGGLSKERTELVPGAPDNCERVLQAVYRHWPQFAPH